MTPEEKKAQLSKDWADYCAEGDKMKAEGKAIGTFLSWIYVTGRSHIKIAMTKDEHFRPKG
jgi:hypothetical protein